MARRQLIVEVIGDDASIQNTFRRTRVAAKETEASLKSLAATSASTALSTNRALGGLNFKSLFAGAAGGAGFVAATAAAAGLASALREGVHNAAQLENSSQAIKVQFGGAAKSVEAFAKSSTGLGISAVQSEQLSVRLGILIQNLGIGREKAAEMTIGLQQLAGSIAEIRGISFETVAQNLPQALAGNLRSLKQLGFAFSQSQIKAEALREGLIGIGDQLTPGAKAQAIYALATRNLAGFLDQAERSSQDLVNQQHILEASVSNLETNMGKLVTGPLTGLVKGLADATGGAQKLAAALGKISKIKLPGGGTSFGEGFRKGFEGAIAPGLTLLGLINQINNASSKRPTAKPAQGFIAAINQIRRDAAGGASDIGSRAVRPPLTSAQRRTAVQQRNQFFDAAVGRQQDLVQDIPAIQGQIAALQKIAAKIQQRIATTKDVTRKLKLESDLRGVLREIKGDREQLAQNLKDALSASQKTAQDLRDALTDALNLNLERALATPGVRDDLAALAKIQDNIKARIKAEGKTTDLLRQLFENRQQTSEILLQQRTARQFRALGLGPTGDAIIPGVANLKKQLAQLTSRINLGAPISNKLKAQLAGARKVLNSEFGAATKDAREKIDELFQTIRDGFNKGGKGGPLTKTTSLAGRVGEAFAGLGLTREQLKRLQQRFSGFNSAGLALAGPGGMFGPSGITVVVHQETKLDGRVIEHSTTKHQQLRHRRNPSSRRGRR